VELARLSASSANLQPLKYFLSYDAGTNQKIFSCLKWAGYLRNWQGPAEGERPSAYIVILGDTKISTSFGYDPGIAAQSILLGAVERGVEVLLELIGHPGVCGIVCHLHRSGAGVIGIGC